MPWDGFLAGVAFGYEATEVDSFFNAGGQDVDGFSVIPYLGVFLSEAVDVDFDLSADFVSAPQEGPG